MKVKNPKRGLFLVSALLVSMVIVLFVGAALRLAIGNQKAGRSGERQALLAAESGLRYVQTRLAQDYTWKADAGLVVQDSDLIVHEEGGNVVGLLRVPEGGFAQFRVRFNYQDDAGDDTDGLSDPASAFVVDHPYVSVNNLFGGSAKAVPRADGPQWSVTSGSSRPYKVPSNSVCVIVEGRYGPGLGDLSASNMNPPVRGACSTRVVEAYLEPSFMRTANAVTMSAGDMRFEMEGNSALTLSAKDKNQESRLRSRSTIQVLDGGSPNLTSQKGETYTPSGGIQADADSSISTQVEDSGNGFYKLEWGQVRKALGSDPALDAGTYVVWDDGSLHYYDMDYSAYVAHISGNPTDRGSEISAGSLPSSLQFDNSNPAKPRFTVTGNLNVTNTGTSQEFNLIPRIGVQEDPPGSVTNLTRTQMVRSILTDIGDPISVSSMSAKWRIPIHGSIPGGRLKKTYKQGKFLLKLFKSHEISLTEVSPGVAELEIDDFSIQTDFVPKIGHNPKEALEYGLKNLFNGWSGLDTLLQTTVEGSMMHEIDLGSVVPSLRADDISIEFAPPEGETAILSADGYIRLGSNIQGDGGSITSGESIRLIGNGTDLSASLENGLTLYAKQSIVLSSLKETTPNSNSWMYKDLKLKGVLYSWGSIEMKLNNGDPSVVQAGKLLMEGALVAYGGDPSGSPGNAGGGDITVRSDEAELKYNPAYIFKMDSAPPPSKLTQTLYTTY